MKNIGKAFIAIILFLFTLFVYKVNIGISWKEKIILPNINIVDPITYELSNAIIIFSKEEVKNELKKRILDYDTTHRDLLTHLDTLKGNFKLADNDLFAMKPDTISVGLIKSFERVKNISKSDWARDTTILVKDFNDKRNFFFHSMELVAAELLYNKKVMLYDMQNNRVNLIYLSHEKSGLNNSFSDFEFKNGEYILTKDASFGL